MKRGFGDFRVMHRVDLALTRVFLVILNPGIVGRRKFSPEHYWEQLRGQKPFDQKIFIRTDLSLIRLPPLIFDLEDQRSHEEPC